MSEKTLYKGHIIEIVPDDDSFDPLEGIDTFKMICFHRRYDLGHKHSFADPEALDLFLRKHKPFYMKIYMYDHSGLAFRLSRADGGNPFYGRLPQGHAEFDSGQVGVVYMLRSDLKKWYNNDTEKAEITMRSVIEEEYQAYVNGWVYAYVIKDMCDEIADSCGGFTDSNDAMKAAKDEIDERLRLESLEKIAELERV